MWIDGVDVEEVESCYFQQLQGSHNNLVAETTLFDGICYMETELFGNAYRFFFFHDLYLNW